MERISPTLILTLSVLVLCLAPAIYVLFGAVRWMMFRQKQEMSVLVEALDKAHRKVLSLSDKPSAQQIAALEAQRMLLGGQDTESSDENQMAQ